jgi:hypothetical protein
MASAHNPESFTGNTDDDDSILMTPDMSDYQLLHTPQTVTTDDTTTNTTDMTNENTHDIIIPQQNDTAPQTSPLKQLTRIAMKPTLIKPLKSKKISRIINSLYAETNNTPTSNTTPDATTHTVTPERYKVHFVTNLMDSGLPRALFSNTCLLPPNYHTDYMTYHRVVNDAKQRISRMEPYATLLRGNVKFDFYALISYESSEKSPFRSSKSSTITVPYNSIHMCTYLPPPLTTFHDNLQSHTFTINMTFRLCPHAESHTEASTQMSDSFLQNNVIDFIQNNINQWYHIRQLDTSRGTTISPTPTMFPIRPLMSLPTAPPLLRPTPLVTVRPVPITSRLGPPVSSPVRPNVP